MVRINRRTALQIFGGYPAVKSLATAFSFESTSSLTNFSSHEPETYLDNAPNPLISVRDARWALMASSLRGWGQAERQQVEEEILRINPDLIHEGLQGCDRGPPAEDRFWREYRIVREFAMRHEIPFDMGVVYRIKPVPLYEHWYSQLPDEEKWRHPNGLIVEHPREIARRKFDGSVSRYESELEGVHDTITPSLFADATGDHLIQCGQDIYEFGANYFWVDIFIDALLDGMDFSEWARAAFQRHLQQLTGEQLEELGISDPVGFDFKAYLQDRGIAPTDNVSPPYSDPVFREYQLLHHLQQKQLVERVAEGTRTGLPDELLQAGTSFHGEGHWLQWQALNAANIYMADHLDVIHVGLGHPTIPPHRPHDVSVKLGRAVGKFEKPVFVDGSEWSVQGTLFGVDPTEYYPTLIRFALAQAYCHGGTRRLPLTTLGNNSYDSTIKAAMRPNGTVGESIHEFIDFIQAHRRFLRDFEETNDTVVMVSLPSLLYRAPQWGWYGTGHELPLGAAATVLRREHIPYDVQVFDHRPLWAAPDQTESLPDYNRIILPGITCVSDSQVDVIKDALAAGATIIATAGAPTRDVDYQPRDDLRQMLSDADNGVILGEFPERGPNQTVKDGPGMAALADVLSETHQRVVLQTDADISLNLFKQTDSNRYILHLLNFEYDPEADSMETHEDVSVLVRDLGLEVGAAKFYTPKGITTLTPVSTEGGIEVTVPNLDVWGFIVYAEHEGALVAPVSESAAAEVIAEVEVRLDSTSLDEPERTRISMKFQNARAAFEYEAYGVARNLAKEALKIWSDIETPTPTPTPSRTPSPTSTPNRTPSPTSTPSASHTNRTETNTPGFGFGITIGSVLGAAALFRKLRKEDNE